MKKYRLFIVNSQQELLNAVNLVFNTPGYNDHLNYIILNADVSNVMPANYRETLGELFEQVFEVVNVKHPEKTRLRQLNATCPAGLRRSLFSLWIKIAGWFLGKFTVCACLKFCLGPRFCDARYMEIYLQDNPLLTCKIFSYLYHHDGVRTIHMLDEGMASYINPRVFKYFLHQYNDLQFIFHLYAPQFIAFPAPPLGRMIPLPVLSRHNTAFLRYLNRLFGYSSDNFLNRGIEFVILDQNIQTIYRRKQKKLRKQLFDFKVRLYQMAADAFGMKLWLKVHPRFISNKFIEQYQFKNIHIEPGAYNWPFELLLLNAKTYPGIISVSSTAAFSPYIAMDGELGDYKLIVLDRLFKLEKLSDRQLNKDRFIDQLEAKYKFYRPRTVEEYRQILQSLST